MLKIILRQRWMLVGLACFLGLFAVYVIDAHRKPTLVRYLAQKNIPANMDQLKAMYPEAPESENGITLLFRAANKIKEPNREEYENIPFAGGSEVEFGAPLTTEQRDALQHYVDSHEEVLAMIYEALDYPYVRLTHHRYGIEVDYLSTLRKLSRFLYTVAIHAAIDNDVTRSFDATKANFAVTEISIYGSDFMSELTRFAVLGLVIESLAKTMSYTTLTPSMIHAYMEILAVEEARIIKCHQDALKTDCAMDLPGQRYHGRFFEDVPDRFIISLFLGRVGREWNQLAFFAERLYVRELEELLDRGNQDIYKALSFSSRDSTVMMYSPFSDNSTKGVYRALRQVYIGSLGNYWAPAKYMATAASARTALAAQLFYYDHGNMPDTLDALVPEYLDALPRDPFTPDQPIRFRMDGNNALFYSIGRNETDNGGVDDDDNCKDCDDIVFRLKIPQANTPLDPHSQENL
jgi:hypothetical protein